GGHQAEEAAGTQTHAVGARRDGATRKHGEHPNGKNRARGFHGPDRLASEAVSGAIRQERKMPMATVRPNTCSAGMRLAPSSPKEARVGVAASVTAKLVEALRA